MQRFIVRFGQRVSISPLVPIVAVAIVVTLATVDLPRPVLTSLLALQVTVILLGVRIRRSRSNSRKAS